MSSESLESASLAEDAYRRIEEMIVTRTLKPGAMISEKQLAEELQYGRTPVREALQRLRLEGYIKVHPSRGIQVSAIDVFRQFELLEVRRPLEDLVVRLAAERATSAERAAMADLATRFTSVAVARDRPAYLATNRAIHQAIAKAAHNAILANSIGAVHGLSRCFWYAYIEDEDFFEEAARLHSKTVKSIVARDAAGAAGCAADFLNFLESLTRKALSDRVGMR